MNQPRAYEGREPYIFISYAHLDRKVVLPIISALQQRGFRVWYDIGIELGTEWPEYIAQHLNNSAVCLAFVSQAAMNSFFCRREINFAIAQRKELVAIYLENVNMPLGMQMQLGSVQGMYYDRHPSMESFVEELCRSGVVAACGGSPQSGRQSEEDPMAVCGRGMEFYEQRNYPEAVKCFRYAAERGEAAAQTLLGLCYSNGYGVTQNEQEAARWYQKAVNQGNDSAMMLLGMCYCTGRGVTEDFDNGIQLIRRSAALGNEEAQEMLQTLGMAADPAPSHQESSLMDKDLAYEKGKKYYEKKDYAKALPLLAQAAEQDNSDALYLLAKSYLFGEGVEENITVGYAMMEEAAYKGNYLAKQFLKALNDDSNPLDE